MRVKTACCAAVCIMSMIVSGYDIFAQQKNAPQAKSNLAVMSFESNTADREIGTTASELVRCEIMTLDDIPYTLIERGMLNAVLKEHELAMSGAIEEKENARVGKLLYADYLIVGRLTKVGGIYRLTAAIVDTNSAAVRKQAYDDLGSMNDLPLSAKRVAYRLFGRTAPESPRSAEKPAGEADPRHEKPDGIGKASGSFAAVYTDKKGFHGGGSIHFEQRGDQITGYSDDPIGRAEISAAVSGEFINGYYKASYGYGNFTFRITENGRCLIGSYYQVSNGARGDWIAVRGASFSMPKELFTGRWKEGSRCLVKWSGDDYWYPAGVDAIKDGLYHVNYDDGDAEWRLEKHMLPEKLSQGDEVFGNWQSKGRYYRGKIAERKGDKIFIHYDDGDKEWTTVGKVRVRSKQ